jgi:hypothetical protein
MVHIGRRCTIEEAKRCIPEQNHPPNPVLVSASAVDPEISHVCGLEVERRSTPGDKKGRGTPPLDPQISLRYPAEDVSKAV